MKEMPQTLLRLLAMLLVLTGAACFPDSDPADLVLRNGIVVTLDPLIPEAQALAVRDGRILAVGTDGAVERHIGPATRVIDLRGRTAIPGFIEGHGHLLGIGQALEGLDLGEAGSWEQVVARVGEAAGRAAPGEWIVGRGWHQERWEPRPSPNVEGYPLHHELSAVTPENPVWLVHTSGHAGFANALAMERAGVDASTPDPEGGEILRDSSGAPTGLFRQRAQGLVTAALGNDREARPAEETEGEHRRLIRLALREVLANGITSFQDAGSSFATVDLLRRMAEEEGLGARLWVMLRADPDELEQKMADYRMVGVGDHRLTVRAVKLAVDGALGTHGAWLLEPYEDRPDSVGFRTTPLETVERVARLALEHDFQLCVHAIGDRANREILDLYERIFEENGNGRDLRWRIEHAQHLHPDDVPRFAELGVVPSMQGVHGTSDGPWVVKRLGEERARRGAYAWRALLDAGARVTNGTDAPVEDLDPIAGYYASVTRRLEDGSRFFPEQRMTREEALKTYTLNNAYAAFEEGLKGSLTPGKLADVVILSQNILTVPEDKILDTRVEYTIVGGRIEYMEPAGGWEAAEEGGR